VDSSEELRGQLSYLVAAECEHHAVGGYRKPRMALHTAPTQMKKTGGKVPETVP
jgi:hypothetical protein